MNPFEEKPKYDTIIVSCDWGNGDIPVLLVGRKAPKKPIEVLNSFQGNEAMELYRKLCGKEARV